VATTSALVLLSKPGCHLCDEMRAVVEPELHAHGWRLIERDVRDDPEMEDRYRLHIPVLLFEGREVARHRITREELRQWLATLGIA
jgi:hypothetical protein